MTVSALLERVRARRLPPPAERRRLREAAGLSLRDVGEAVGVSHAAVSRWERGAHPRSSIGSYAELLAGLQELEE